MADLAVNGASAPQATDTPQADAPVDPKAAQDFKNATADEVTGSLATANAYQPTSAEGYANNEAIKAVGNDIGSIAVNGKTPDAAQAPLADAAASYKQLADANASGDLDGAAKAFSGLKDAMTRVTAATGGDVSPTNQAVSEANTDVNSLGGTLQALRDAGAGTPLQPGTKNSLDGAVSGSLDSLNKMSHEATEPTDLANLNALRGTGFDLGAAASRLGNPGVPQDLQGAVSKANDDYNTLVANGKQGLDGLKAEATGVKALQGDLVGIATAYQNASPADGSSDAGQDSSDNVVPNLVTTLDDVGSIAKTANDIAVKQGFA